jgi:hypothetical protein
MNKKLILILFLFFGTTTFSQTLPQTDTEKNICSKGLQAMALLKTYITKQSLSASFKAVKLLDTTQLLIEKLNKDSLAIPSEDFSTIKNTVAMFQKQDYKKVLADEKKAPKVKAKIEGGVFMLSKNNFIPLYTYIRILESLFDDWNKKL